MAGTEEFKTTLVGGYDKDDVQERFRQVHEQNYAEKSKLMLEIGEKDTEINELRAQLRTRENEVAELQQKISGQYQKYVDNYESIGKLVFDAQMRAEQIVAEANEEHTKLVEAAKQQGEQIIAEANVQSQNILTGANAQSQSILAEAQAEAQRRLERVQKDIGQTIEEGKKKYVAVQEEMNAIVEVINQAQRRFMESYKEVHQIVDGMPETMPSSDDEN